MIKIIIILLIFTGAQAAQANFSLYPPQKALSDANSEALTYLGKFISVNSESGRYPECVFKNSKVIVISSYCVKAAVPAGRIVILPANAAEGHVRFYVEIAGSKDISRAPFNEYIKDMMYTAVVVPQKSHDLEMTFSEIKNWYETETDDYGQMCVTSNSSSKLPNSTYCKNMPGSTAAWSKMSVKFLKASDPNFVKLLRTLKSLVP